jgi:hypothetical protein
VYSDTLFTIGGCDSVIILNLQTANILFDTLDTNSLSICSGESYLIDGRQISIAGIYPDTLTALGGCDSVIIVSLSVTSPPDQQLCVVTADTTSAYNIVVWEKENKYATDSFYIYRADTPDSVYNLIVAQGRDSLSAYDDLSSNPNGASYRYKINLKDTCGNLNPLSNYHQTIYLEYMGAGVFDWIPYVIENDTSPVTAYDLYRDSSGNGNWALLTAYLPTQFTGSDPDYSGYPHARYKMVVNLSTPCNPTRSYNTITSNVISQGSAGIINSGANNNLKLLTNPVSSTARIINITGPVKVELRDNIGRTLALSKTDGNSFLDLDVGNFASGIYYILVLDNSGCTSLKLIKN